MNKEHKIRKEEVGSRKTRAGLWVSWFLTAIIEVRIGIRARQLPACRTGRKQTAIVCLPLSFAVDFSQRTKRFANETGLQPKTIWLKPVASCQQPATIERNSTVKKIQITSVIIDLPEEIAIRACGLHGIYNN